MQFCFGSLQLRGVAICVLGFFEPACALDLDEDMVWISERVERGIRKFKGVEVEVLMRASTYRKVL